MFINTVRLICVRYCFDLALVNIISLVFDICCEQNPMFNNNIIITMAVEICGTFACHECVSSLNGLGYVFVCLRSAEMYSCHL